MSTPTPTHTAVQPTLAAVQAKLLAAQNCHPNAVQHLIAEALDAIDAFARAPVAPSGQPLAQTDSKEGFGDPVSAPVEPSGATLQPGAASQWISISERLPEIGAEVLVFAPTKDRHRVTALARFIRYEGAADYYWDNVYPGKGNMYLSQSVTHWMPLPAPPQVDRGESSSKGGES